MKHCFVLCCRVLKHNWPHNWLHATFRGRNCSISKEMASRLVLLLSLFSTFTFAKHYLVEVEEGAGDQGGADENIANNDTDDGDNVEAPGDDAKAPAVQDYSDLFRSAHIDPSYKICGFGFGRC